MTSFRNRIRQRIEKDRKRLTRREIDEKVKEDWAHFSEIEGIKDWMSRNPDLINDLRKRRGELIIDRIKRDFNGK